MVSGEKYVDKEGDKGAVSLQKGINMVSILPNRLSKLDIIDFREAFMRAGKHFRSLNGN